ncbi:hypothetical protein ACTVNI_25745, partial [Serratia bockelmannii]
MSFEESPPTCHEVRSLAGRLYEKERGKYFAQKLLWHSSEVMTLKYPNTRRKAYVMQQKTKYQNSSKFRVLLGVDAGLLQQAKHRL